MFVVLGLWVKPQPCAAVSCACCPNDSDAPPQTISSLALRCRAHVADPVSFQPLSTSGLAVGFAPPMAVSCGCFKAALFFPVTWLCVRSDVLWDPGWLLARGLSRRSGVRYSSDFGSNVDDCIESDCGDYSLCRDVPNPVGNDSIDHHVRDCSPGYEEVLAGTHKFCENINDCPSSSLCNLVGSCEDALQSYRCSCNAGFETVVLKNHPNNLMCTPQLHFALHGRCHCFKCL